MNTNKKLPGRLLFVHVPKAGGSTFVSLLQRNLKNRLYSYYGLWDKYMFAPDDITGMCTAYPEYLSISSHRFSLHLPWDNEDLNIHAIAFVRDPVKRLLSWYFFNQQLAKSGRSKFYEPIDDFFDRVLDGSVNNQWENSQFSFLSRYDHSSLSFERIQSLSDSGRLLLAPLDRFDDACVLLEQVYPQLLVDMSYGSKKNISEWNQPITDELIVKINKANQLDANLYALSHKLLDQRLYEHLGKGTHFTNLVTDYNTRCRTAQRNEALLQPIRNVKKYLQALRSRITRSAE